MTKDEMPKRLSQVPFVPFEVRLVGGQDVEVPTAPTTRTCTPTGGHSSFISTRAASKSST
jgi:hypothetical protein